MKSNVSTAQIVNHALAAGMLLATTLAYATNIGPMLAANGYSGMGLIPSAQVLKAGTWQAAYGSKMPGAISPTGHNFLLGYGAREDFEFSLRLATQDFDCNFYKSECPPNTIRDLSGSFKYALPLPEWIKSRQVRMAVGANDVGGAATFFRSAYVVASAPIGPLHMTAGTARGTSIYSTLDGPFINASLRPWQGFQVSAQQVGSFKAVAAHYQRKLTEAGTTIHVGYTHPFTATPRQPAHQWQLALTVPMGVQPMIDTLGAQSTPKGSHTVRPVALAELRQSLQAQGFWNPWIRAQAQTVHVQLENTGYRWNTLDAAGVAAGVVAGLPAEGRTTHIHLTILESGMPALTLQAPTSCLKEWLETGHTCPELTWKAPLSGLANGSSQQDSADDTTYARHPWSLSDARLELLVSPVIASTIGTEVGSLDYHLGVNLNPRMQLWPGATLEANRLEATPYKSREFRDGGLFAADVLRTATTRAMFHQFHMMPQWRTALRATVGRGFTEWRGIHLESLSSLPGWDHWLHLSAGKFKGPQPFNKLFNLPIVDAPRHREYRLVQYGVRWGGKSSMTTELTAGRYWRQDEGFDVLHRFWFGDTSVGVYYRKSKMPEALRPVAFAGLQLNVPLTFRKATGWSVGGIRGNQDFGYRVESKVGEQDNILTQGYGEVPRFGENLNTVLNRSRWSQQYFENNAWRMRQAHRELGN